MQQPLVDKNFLQELVKAKMPFGKYKNKYLHQLPMAYLAWMARKGFPKNKLGMQLQTMYEIQLNGLMYLLQPFIQP
jgi:uncharacterized protein (DUF3820 family)